ncbi:MAG: alpha/beta hydrolase [Xanthomonadales bacterium]|nr:alpha/beta hydrolase [Xanthomonadales bacterium]
MKIKPAEAVRENGIDMEIQLFAHIIQQDYACLATPGQSSLAEQRGIAERVRKRWVMGGPEMFRVSNHRVPFREGQVGIRLFEPDAATDSPALVYLHGGGWTIFSLETHDRLMREYAARTGFKVVGVDFSLAPENKFPSQIDEIEAVITWLQIEGSRLGICPERLAIGGDSAGANLAMATCLRMRDRGLASGIRAMLLCYGAFDAGAPYTTHEIETDANFLLTHEEMRGFWRNYLRGPADVSDPLACPMRADLRAMPSTFMAIADWDILLDENLSMAAKLTKVGVMVEAVVYPGTTHSFLEAVSIARISDRALAETSGWLGNSLNY